MSKSLNKKGRSTHERFAMLPFYLLKSEAWRSLRPQARAVYIELLSRYSGTNNGDISMSVREASDLCNIAIGTACKCFYELQEKGIIRCRSKGSFHLKLRHASEWVLTSVELDGQRPTKEFIRWRPAEEKSTVSI